MSLASLYNIPTNQPELDNWSFCHMVHHRDINNQIFILTGVRIDEYILDPIDPHDPGEWEYVHQTMHAATNNILGLGGGFDLSEVSWNDPSRLSGWIYQNGEEHRQWSNFLGVD